jgi:RNA polymerase sigma factor (sigma-70 family)
VARRRLSSRAVGSELLEVFRENVDAVYAFFSYSVSHEHAEALTAATFEQVVRSWNRFDPDLARPRTWIVVAIARKILADHFRRASHSRSTALDEHPALAASLASSADPAMQRLSVTTVRDWLGGLEPREREVLALRFGADLPAADIAGALDLNEAAVYQISSRALQRLRDRPPGSELTDNA